MPTRTWLLLIDQIPLAPLYFRAKILRRIKQLGAVAVKKSAYVLPSGPECLEDLQWLRKEIVAGGGEAWIIEGQFRGGEDDDALVAEFMTLRAADYAALALECREVLSQVAPDSQAPALARVGRIEKRFAEIEAIDFFGAQGKEEVRRMLDEMERLRNSGADPSHAGARPGNATWVTRAGVKVDRMSSAWLIRRFIDPGARFRFLDDPSDHRPGEIRFDTFEGEFTHEDDLCTFEVLARRMGLEQRGVRAIGEIVHDLDRKESKYQRPETAGVDAFFAGIRKRFPSDAARIEQASAFLDTLYAQLDAEE